jgi:L-asparaginase II
MPAIEDYGPADHTPRTAVSTHQPRHAPLAHVVCADVIEGVHYGSIVILSADGRVEFQAGDIKAAFDPNSALRPIQAVGMLRAGLSLEGELLAYSPAVD